VADEEDRLYRRLHDVGEAIEALEEERDSILARLQELETSDEAA
jgi:hypothetical protein